MDKKGLIAIAICGVLVASMIFGAYQIGVSNGTSKGYTQGLRIGATKSVPIATGLAGQIAYLQGNETGYAQGYQDGLKAQTNGTG